MCFEACFEYLLKKSTAIEWPVSGVMGAAHQHGSQSIKRGSSTTRSARQVRPAGFF